MPDLNMNLLAPVDEYQTEADRIRSLTGYQDVMPVIQGFAKQNEASLANMTTALQEGQQPEKSTLGEKIAAGLGAVAYLADLKRKKRPAGLNEQAAALAGMLNERRTKRKTARQEKAQNAIQMEKMLMESRSQNVQLLMQGIQEGNRQKATIAQAALDALDKKQERLSRERQWNDQVNIWKSAASASGGTAIDPRITAENEWEKTALENVKVLFGARMKAAEADPTLLPQLEMDIQKYTGDYVQRKRYQYMGLTPPEEGTPRDAFGQPMGVGGTGEGAAGYDLATPTGLPLGPGENVLGNVAAYGSGEDQPGVFNDLVNAIYPNMPKGLPGGTIGVAGSIGYNLWKIRENLRQKAAENRARQ